MFTLWCLQKGCSGGSPRAPSSANNSVPELDLTVSDGSSKRGEVASSTFSGACCKPLRVLASAEGDIRAVSPAQPVLWPAANAVAGTALATAPTVLLCSRARAPAVLLCDGIRSQPAAVGCCHFVVASRAPCCLRHCGHSWALVRCLPVTTSLNTSALASSLCKASRLFGTAAPLPWTLQEDHAHLPAMFVKSAAADPTIHVVSSQSTRTGAAAEHWSGHSCWRSSLFLTVSSCRALATC